jgi:hypothetical protein
MKPGTIVSLTWKLQQRNKARHARVLNPQASKACQELGMRGSPRPTSPRYRATLSSFVPGYLGGPTPLRLKSVCKMGPARGSQHLNFLSEPAEVLVQGVSKLPSLLVLSVTIRARFKGLFVNSKKINPTVPSWRCRDWLLLHRGKVYENSAEGLTCATNLFPTNLLVLQLSSV